MRLSGAIFDLDGTLLDSMFIWDTVGEDYLRSCGMQPHEALNEKFKNMSLYQAACYYRDEYGMPGSAEEIMGGVNRLIAHFYMDEVQPKAGVPEMLEALKKRGVKMCVASATDRPLVKAALSRCGLLGYFEEIFTCSSVGHGKDEPDIFLAALDFLGTPKESTWVFEDALHAAQTAKAAGFPVLAVYDRSEKDQDALAKLADVYVRSFAEMEASL